MSELLSQLLHSVTPFKMTAYDQKLKLYMVIIRSQSITIQTPSTSQNALDVYFD